MTWSFDSTRQLPRRDRQVSSPQSESKGFASRTEVSSPRQAMIRFIRSAEPAASAVERRRIPLRERYPTAFRPPFLWYSPTARRGATASWVDRAVVHRRAAVPSGGPIELGVSRGQGDRSFPAHVISGHEPCAMFG